MGKKRCNNCEEKFKKQEMELKWGYRALDAFTWSAVQVWWCKECIKSHIAKGYKFFTKKEAEYEAFCVTYPGVRKDISFKEYLKEGK